MGKASLVGFLVFHWFSMRRSTERAVFSSLLFYHRPSSLWCVYTKELPREFLGSSQGNLSASRNHKPPTKFACSRRRLRWEEQARRRWQHRHHTAFQQQRDSVRMKEEVRLWLYDKQARTFIQLFSVRVHVCFVLVRRKAVPRAVFGTSTAVLCTSTALLCTCTAFFRPLKRGVSTVRKIQHICYETVSNSICSRLRFRREGVS